MALLRTEAPLIYFLISSLWEIFVVAIFVLFLSLAATAAVSLYKRLAYV